MRRDLVYYYEAPLTAVQDAFIQAAKGKFGKDCTIDSGKSISFALNFTFKYNMNGGKLTIHFMPYQSGTAVNLRYTIVQAYGARYKAHARDLTVFVNGLLHVQGVITKVDVNLFLQYENNVTSQEISAGMASPTTVNQPQPNQAPPQYNQPRPNQAPPQYNQQRPNQAPPQYNQPQPNQAPPQYNQPRPNQAPPQYNQPQPNQAPPQYNQQRPNQAPLQYNQPRPNQVPPQYNQPRPNQVPPQNTQAPRFCTACGAPLLPDAFFCTKCGKKIQ